LKANFVKLPDFIGGAVDFGALAFANNFSKMLAQDGYLHVNAVQERDLEGLGELGVVSRSMRRSIRNFMKSFWVNFGRIEARSMAELRRAEVSSLQLDVLHSVFGFMCWPYKLVLAFAGATKERSCSCRCWRSTSTSYCVASSEGSIPCCR
jgi:hypothetical protein